MNEYVREALHVRRAEAIRWLSAAEARQEELTESLVAASREAVMLNKRLKALNGELGLDPHDRSESVEFVARLRRETAR